MVCPIHVSGNNGGGYDGAYADGGYGKNSQTPTPRENRNSAPSPACMLPPAPIPFLA